MHYGPAADAVFKDLGNWRTFPIEKGLTSKGTVMAQDGEVTRSG